MDINRNNYETYFLLYLDRELRPEEMLGVEKFLTENTDLKKEFALLQQTIQFPADIVFEQKESLFRTEEKRRIVPFYRLRIAAAIAALVLCSWLVKIQLMKNQIREVAGTIQPVALKKNPAGTGDANKNRANQTREELRTADNQIENKNNSAKNGSVSNGRQKDQEELKGKNKPDKKNTKPGQDPQNSNTDNVPDESGIAVQKSSANLQVQSAETLEASRPKQISSLPGIGGQTLLVSVDHSENAVKTENAVLKEPDYQTEDAISVVALNDRNKNITGFFKKLVNRAPADDNTRKIRVSVFQISY